jgi:hypothetical protein
MDRFAKRIKPFFDALTEFGIDIVDRRCGKHMVITCLYRGERFKTCIPNSASDWRAVRNFRRELRQACRRIDAMLDGCIYSASQHAADSRYGY